MKYHYIHYTITESTKTEKAITSVGEDIEQLALSYLICTVYTVTLENSLVVSYKVKYNLTLWPSTAPPIIDIYSRQMNTRQNQKKTQMSFNWQIRKKNCDIVIPWNSIFIFRNKKEHTTDTCQNGWITKALYYVKEATHEGDKLLISGCLRLKEVIDRKEGKREHSEVMKVT